MPIALMFPFAEAAGITLTGLGIAKATDIIMNYIQANPEKSKQILSTLMPTIGGIGSMLMKEKSEGTSGEEQPTKQKDTRSKKEIVLDAIRRGREGRGNYSSPDAVGPAVSIRGNVIRGLEDAGKVSKERKTQEEMKEENKTKKPFDYKKFYKAEGGLMNMSFEDWLKGKQKYDMEELYNDYLEDLKQKKLEKKYPRDEAADGGRIGYIGGGLATTQDYATALSKVGAGTEEQKRRSVSDYAQNEAYGLLSKATSTPGGLTDLYNNYIKGTAVNSRAFDFGRDASTMNTATAMNPQYKQNIIDQIAYTMQQNTPYRKTYPFENASMQELMPAGTVGSKNFESNITTPQEAAALARYIALQRGVDMQQYDAEQAATNAGTLDDFYRNLGLQTPTLRTGIPFAMGGPVSMTKNGVTTLFSMKR
jgi:hypothetical protein